MNPLAVELNETLAAQSPAVRALLAPRGERLYFPRGILSQSAEAKKKAYRYNATIGIATEGGEPMHLACIHKYFQSIPARDLYGYAPATGRPDLRAAWQEKIRAETPSLGSAELSLPVVTNALTHGLSVAGDLFVGEGDRIVVPDKLWGNYRLIFEVRLGGSIATFPFYEGGGYNVAGLRASLLEAAEGGKVVAILNFPSNPTGYMPSPREMEGIAEALAAAAERAPVVVLCDDAYYGLFHADGTATESIFGTLAGLHENLLAVKIDGATKEEFVWGFRTGFVTYGTRGGAAPLYDALVAKTGGAVRGMVSNCSHPAQSIVLRALADPAFRGERDEKRARLRARGQAAARAAGDPAHADCWELYPFNAGYFLCIRVKGVDAEALRVRLLETDGLGTISIGSEDLRIAFSCLETEEIPVVFERIAAAIRALRT